MGGGGGALKWRQKNALAPFKTENFSKIWIMGRESRPWTRGLRITYYEFRMPYSVQNTKK